MFSKYIKITKTGSFQTVHQGIWDTAKNSQGYREIFKNFKGNPATTGEHTLNSSWREFSVSTVGHTGFPSMI